MEEYKPTGAAAIDEIIQTQQEEPPTESQIRQYRHDMITRRNSKVQACGHKYRAENDMPRHLNCENCWWAYFTLHGDVTKLADEIFRMQGRKALIQIRGRKFVDMFTRYMSTVAKLVKEGKIQTNEDGTVKVEE